MQVEHQQQDGLEAKIRELELKLHEAQQAEVAVRRKHQDLIDNGITHKADFEIVSRDLDFQTLMRKKADAKVDQLSQLIGLRTVPGASGSIHEGSTHSHGTHVPGPQIEVSGLLEVQQTGGGVAGPALIRVASGAQGGDGVQFSMDEMNLLQVDTMVKEVEKVCLLLLCLYCIQAKCFLKHPCKA
jgi:hypothetical protein